MRQNMGKYVITVVSILIIGAIGIKCTSSYTGLDQSAAQQSARGWAIQMGMQDAKVTCVKMDTDNDGYISCSVLKPNSGEIIALQCSGWMTLNSGCRLLPFNLRAN